MDRKQTPAALNDHLKCFYHLMFQLDTNGRTVGDNCKTIKS